MYAAGNPHFTIDIFNGEQIAVIHTQKGLNDFVRQNWPDDHESQSSYRNLWEETDGAMCREGAQYFMFIRRKSHRLIAHESVHCAVYMMQKRGIPLTVENQEILAYLTDYAFSEVCRIVGLGVK